MKGKSVQELRKQLTQEIQINSVRQIGTCQAPSKVIRMLNKATLINILTDGFIDWNTLDNNDGIVLKLTKNKKIMIVVMTQKVRVKARVKVRVLSLMLSLLMTPANM